MACECRLCMEYSSREEQAAARLRKLVEESRRKSTSVAEAGAALKGVFSLGGTANRDLADHAADEKAAANRQVYVAVDPAEVRMPSVFEQAVDRQLTRIRESLLAKNAAYGNSALEPIRVFSQADPLEQLNVRIDDKISRLQKGREAGEDAAWDLLGYLVLREVAKEWER